jgi:ribosomal protein S18 acetylase RimI-like enzyme
MADFPDTFSEELISLSSLNLGQAGLEAFQKLSEADYEVKCGLTEEYAAKITAMTQEPSIRLNCPKDSSERFTDLEATKKWLQKKRGSFLLLKKEDDGSLSLAGYGWAGNGTSDKVPQGQTTFAVRVSENHQGKGLAAPFSWLIIAGSAVIYGARDFWLETWQSNGGAVHTYHKLGFEDVAEEAGERVTPDGQLADTRLYMSLPNELLP